MTVNDGKKSGVDPMVIRNKTSDLDLSGGLTYEGVWSNKRPKEVAAWWWELL